MTKIDDEVFDAMLRVALVERRLPARTKSRTGQATRAPVRRPTRLDVSQPGSRRSRLTPWLVVAGLLVCVGVWWLGRAAPSAAVDREPAHQRRLGQDPQPDGPMRQAEFERIARHLGDPTRRAAATRALVDGGPVAVKFLVARIGSEPASLAGDEPNSILEGLLLAAAAFGQRSAAFVKVTESRLPEVHAEQMVAALELFTEAALWAEVPEPEGEVGGDFMTVHGRTFDELEVRVFNRCMVALGRGRARRVARERALAGRVVESLAEKRRRRGDTADIRLATINRLAHEPTLKPEVLSALEVVLRTDHPPFTILSWTPKAPNRAVVDHRDSNGVLHRAAADLLVRRAPEHPTSVLAHALVVRQDGEADARRRSTLALGRLLVDPAAHEGRRLDVAISALRSVVTAACADRQAAGQPAGDEAGIALAGDAVTVLGMLGPAAKSALPELETAAKCSDRGLAARARRALDRVKPSRSRDR